MTTLRRELRTKFEEVLTTHMGKKEFDFHLGGELVESLTNAALEVAGIAKQEKKFSDPMWDLQHGNGIALEVAKEIEALHDVALRLEAGLRRGQFPETPTTQRIYRWILERESEGQPLQRFIEWAMEGRRAEYSYIYHQNPLLIKRDWLQVNWPKEAEEVKGSGYYG